MKNTAKNYLVENGFKVVFENDGFISFVAAKDKECWFVHVANRKSDFGKKRNEFEEFAGAWLAASDKFNNCNVKMAAVIVRKHDIEMIEVVNGESAPDQNEEIPFDSEFHAKSVRMAKVYCERKGYRVVDSEKLTHFDFVILDEDVIGFVKVQEKKGEMPEDFIDRRVAEFAAALWLASDEDDEYANCVIRFDTIGLAVLDDDRALIRHHINAMG